MAEVVIKGMEELVRKLDALTDAVAGSVLQAAVASGGLLVQNDAKRRAPYKTGTLRRSIHSEVSGNRDQATAEIGTDAPYAARLEYGFDGKDVLGRTYHQSPRPYLRPALDENADLAAREIGEALKAAIEAVAG